MVEERIKVIIEAFQKGFTTTMKGVQNNVNSLKNNIHSFNQSMAMGLPAFKKMNTANVSMINTGARLGNKLRMMTHGLRGFRMEMLGVMFFGMGMQRTLFGLIKPSMELFGIFDMFRLMLEVGFLPVAAKLYDKLMPLMEKFMELSPSLQENIGWLVLLGGVIGSLLFFIGMMSLGLGSVIQAFGFLSTVISGVITFLIGLGAGPLAIILALIVGMVLAYKDNFGKFKEWLSVFIDGVKNIFLGLKDIIIKPFQMAIDLVKGDLEGFKTHLTEWVSGFGKLFYGIAEIVISSITMMGLGALKVIQGIYNLLAKSPVGRAIGLDVWEMKTPSIMEAPGYIGPTSPYGTASKGYGGGQSLIINQSNSYNGFTQSDLEMSQREASRRIVDEVTSRSAGFTF